MTKRSLKRLKTPINQRVRSDTALAGIGISDLNLIRLAYQPLLERDKSSRPVRRVALPPQIRKIHTDVENLGHTTHDRVLGAQHYQINAPGHVIRNHVSLDQPPAYLIAHHMNTDPPGTRKLSSRSWYVTSKRWSRTALNLNASRRTRFF